MKEQRCYGCMKMKSQSPVCEHCGYDEQMQNESHQLQAGMVLKEQYLIGKVLGQGGFGITYLGWDLYLDTLVAIKEYFPNGSVMRSISVSMEVTSLTGDVGICFRNNKERFMREAKMLARFSKINEIVQIRNFFLANNTAYIVMEYVEGITLKDYVKNKGGKLTLEETWSIMKPVMEALCKVHKAGLVHRDISPDNIMMIADGKAKLLDFGAVRDVREAAVDKQLTKSTEAILKQGYAPIEQYQSRGSLGSWSDVYALCATIYYCLTGEVPQDAPERLLGEEEIYFQGKIPKLTQIQREALKQGLALRPQDRIVSVEELCDKMFSVQEIENFQVLEAGSWESNVSSSKVPESEGRGKRNAAQVLGLLAVILVIALVTQPGGKKESEEMVQTTTPAAETGEEIPEETTEENLPEPCGDNLDWNLDAETGVLTISGEGEMYDFNGSWQMLAENAETNPVDPNRSFAPWRDYKEDITCVVLEAGVTRIGENAFENCCNLTEVQFHEGLESIGFQAFLATGIEEIVLPEGVKEIEDAAFNYMNKLKTVVLPDSLSTLKEHSIINCISLEKVVIGSETIVETNAIDWLEDWTEEKAEEQVSDVVIYGKTGTSTEDYVKKYTKKYSAEPEIIFRERHTGQCGENVFWLMDEEEKTLYLFGRGITAGYRSIDENWTEEQKKEHVERWLAEGYSKEWMINDYPDFHKLYSIKIEKIVAGPYIKELGYRIFNHLPNLKEVDFGNVEKVKAVFEGCRSLEEIVFSETVDLIWFASLYNCENLRKVSFLSENVVIQRSVLALCSNLEEVHFSRGAVIEDVSGTLFDAYEHAFDGKVPEKMVFYVYEGSDAERYAIKYDIPYVVVEE